MDYKSDIETLRLCAFWFETNYLPSDKSRRLSITNDKDLPNLLHVRIRANSQEELIALDTAVKCYASELNENWRIDFC